MELLTIRESSLGGYTQAIQDAVLQGYRMSDESSKYPWIDQQYNAVLERSDASVDTIGSENTVLESIANKSAGRPRRKL